jgi:Ca2+-binding RTX toxin-like protein
MRAARLTLAATVLLTMALPATAAAAPRCFGKTATIIGTPGADRIRGTPGHDTIVAFGGDDRVRGGVGVDRICAGLGADYVVGGIGADRIDGRNGRDELRGAERDDRIIGGLGSDFVSGGFGNDTLLLFVDSPAGPSGGADTGIGAGGNDRIDSADGRPDDHLFGDRTFGARGEDICVRDPGDAAVECETFPNG